MTEHSFCRTLRLNASVDIAATMAVASRHAYAETQGEPDSVVRLLEELTNAHGAPGFERPIRNILRREWQDLVADLGTDGVGNPLGIVRGPAKGRHVLIIVPTVVGRRP